MNTFFKIFIVMTLFFLTPNLFAAYGKNIYLPTGFWQTIDDVTGQPKAIVEITRTANNNIMGRIIKIYPRPGQSQNELCIACRGKQHNARIVGMVIMENLAQNRNNFSEWNGGQILDPKNGKTYTCNIRLLENGQKLNVRGFIGLPLFGRTQTWHRVNSMLEA